MARNKRRTRVVHTTAARQDGTQLEAAIRAPLIADIAALVARQIIAGAGLTGGGDLSADRTLAADFGSAPGTITEGDDPRLSDDRDPTPHALSHSDGGGDDIDILDLAGFPGGTATFLRADGAFAAAGGGSSSFGVQASSATGAQDDFNVSASQSYVYFTGASPVVIGGFEIGAATPSDGDWFVAANAGTSTVRIEEDGSGSATTNRVSGYESVRGQTLGVGGACLLVYVAGSVNRWRMYLLTPGAPILEPFNAGDYTTSGAMTWGVDAGDQYQKQWVQRGKMLQVSLSIITTTVGGTPSTVLAVKIPGGFTSVLGLSAICRIINNGVGAASICSVNTTATTMNFYVDQTATTAWTACVNLAGMQGDFQIEVQ